MAKTKSLSNYRCTAHAYRTSNITERLFSRTTLIMSAHRKHMAPWKLELLLLFHFKNNLWDVHTVEDVVKEGGHQCKRNAKQEEVEEYPEDKLEKADG